MSKSSAVFDIQKLFWINRHYLKESVPERLISLTIPILQASGWVAEVDGPIQSWIGRLVDVALPRINHLSQIVEIADSLCGYRASEIIHSGEVQEVFRIAAATDVVQELCRQLSDSTGDVSKNWKDIVTAVKSRTGQKGKSLFHPIRIALTGTTSGPELDKLVPLFEEGSRLPLSRKVKNCCQRTCELVEALAIFNNSPS